MSKHNFVVSEPKSTNFSAFNVESIVVEKHRLLLVDIFIRSKYIGTQS